MPETQRIRWLRVIAAPLFLLIYTAAALRYEAWPCYLEWLHEED